MVKYKSRMIVVERRGRILRRFRGINMLRVHNRIEGYRNFLGSSSPSGRTFPGYGEPLLATGVIEEGLMWLFYALGFLRVGLRGTVQYVQTLVDPMVCR